jgi:hypothetical protein
MQLSLFPSDILSVAEQGAIFSSIRRSYWHIRNLRGGRFSQAALRRHYREVQRQKNRLQVGGVEHGDILIF